MPETSLKVGDRVKVTLEGVVSTAWSDGTIVFVDSGGNRVASVHATDCEKLPDPIAVGHVIGIPGLSRLPRGAMVRITHGRGTHYVADGAGRLHGIGDSSDASTYFTDAEFKVVYLPDTDAA